MKVVEMTQTVMACPSAWEGKMEDGSELYVKYRYGNLRIVIDGDTVYEKQLSDGMDGWLGQRQLIKIMNEQGFTVNEDSDLGDELDYEI